LNALIGTAPIRTMFRDAWPSIAGELTNIELSGLQPRLESIAGRLLNTPRHVDVDDELRLPDEQGFRLWCVQNNLSIPGMDRVNREIAEARYIEEYQKNEKEAIERTFDMGGEESSSWGWREN
jgi:hypothetical protein